MNKLNVLWTNKDLNTIKNFLAMYTTNSLKNKWWDEVNVIIWGASNDIIIESVEVQELIEFMLANGVKVEACKACADRIGSTEILEKLGVNVAYLGVALTDYIKSGENMITI